MKADTMVMRSSIIMADTMFKIPIVGICVVLASALEAGAPHSHVAQLPPCREKVNFWRTSLKDITVLGGVELQPERAQLLLKDMGVVVISNATSTTITSSVREMVLSDTSRDIQGLKTPKGRRHSLLEPELQSSVLALLDSIGDVLRTVLEPVLGADATLVELSTITVKLGARPQELHSDTPTEAIQASQIITVQIPLQTLDYHMGPLTVVPRSHRCGHPDLNVLEAEGVKLQTVVPVGSLILYNSRLLHFGGEHTSGQERVNVVLSLMQGKAANLAPMRGSTFALHPALWGRYTLASLPAPCKDHRIDKWQFHEIASTLHLAVSVFGNAALVKHVLDTHCIDSKCDAIALSEALARPAPDGAANAGMRPLDLAAGSGHAEISQVLLGYRAELYSPDPRGLTPLHFAAGEGHTAVVKFLIGARANPHVGPPDTRPLAQAAAKGHAAVCAWLLKSERSKGDDSPAAIAFVAAGWSGHISVIKRMLKGGLDVTVKGSQGYQSLHMSASSGHLPVVRFLVEKRAALDPQVGQLAMSAGHRAVAEFVARKLRASEL